MTMKETIPSVILGDGVKSSERNQPRKPQEDDQGHLEINNGDSQKNCDNDFTLEIGEIEEPHPWNPILSNFPPIDSSSPPLLSPSSAHPTQGSSDTKSGADSQLSSSFKGEWQQSVHSFKKDLEERATGKGEFPIFNNQELRENVAFSEFDSPINALCVSFGSFRCLEVIENKEKLVVKNGAHKLFDKLSEPILPTKVTSGDILRKPRTKELKELDFGSHIFDPGGEKQKREPIDCDGILIHENGMVSNACKVLTEVLESANEMMTKPDELLPQCELYTTVVFDPGGAYVWLRNCHQLMLPVHWEPGGCFQIVKGLVGNGILEQRGGVILSSQFTRACMKMMPFDRGRADLRKQALCCSSDETGLDCCLRFRSRRIEDLGYHGTRSQNRKGVYVISHRDKSLILVDPGGTLAWGWVLRCSYVSCCCCLGERCRASSYSNCCSTWVCG